MTTEPRGNREQLAAQLQYVERLLDSVISERNELRAALDQCSAALAAALPYVEGVALGEYDKNWRIVHAARAMVRKGAN